MKTKKLTLSVPEEMIRRAKSYARRHRTSVSAVVTRLFQSLTDSASQTNEHSRRSDKTPITDSSFGVISLPKRTRGEMISNALSEKYPSQK